MTIPRDSLRYCRTVARKSGSTFASALSFLPREKRDAMVVLYAFMRLTDDLADAATCSFDCRRQ
ncbi:MAG: squalene/phytoene synthase family protein, partial [Planctomycetia bacterium]|nr:squalene/phytoene synthase family protein [Planctomycetia bacterium]